MSFNSSFSETEEKRLGYLLAVLQEVAPATGPALAPPCAPFCPAILVPEFDTWDSGSSTTGCQKMLVLDLLLYGKTSKLFFGTMLYCYLYM